MAEMDPRIYYLDKEDECWVMHDHIKTQYNKVLDKQLEEWIKGNPVHTDKLGEEYALPDGIEYECCPDFSCCVLNAAWSPEKKEVYRNACLNHDEDVKMSMLMGAIAGAMEQEYKTSDQEVPKIHYAGLVSPDETQH